MGKGREKREQIRPCSKCNLHAYRRLSFSYLRSAATASFDMKKFHRNCTATDVVDTGGKFAAGVVDTGGNLTDVVDTGSKFAAVIVDTGGKFVTGINNTSETGGKICCRCR